MNSPEVAFGRNFLSSPGNFVIFWNFLEKYHSLGFFRGLVVLIKSHI